MAIKNPVYKTDLFKAVAPYINSIHPILLAYEIARAHVAGARIKWNENTIDKMCTWVETPQGVDYWAKLSDESESNKRHERKVTDLEQVNLL